MISAKTLNKTAIALVTGTACFVTLGLAVHTFPSVANAEAVKLVAPAQPGFADVVDKVSPAVVSVRVKGKISPVNDDMGPGNPFEGERFDQLPDDHPMKRFFREFGGRDLDKRDNRRAERRPQPMSQGSGFFISEDGYVVTNNHVVEGGSEFVVALKDGTELDAKLIGKDKRTDLAVLKVDETRKFTYVAFAGENSARVGDWVVAVGNPFGLGGTVTAGIVSALGRDIGAGPYDDFLQIDAAVNRGNSGGPAFSLSGEVIGVNTAIFSPSGGNVGIAFAISAKTANEVVNNLIKDGSIKRGWLGVQIQPVSPEIADSLGLKQAKGALVNLVQANSPALKAGIETGDVVLSVGGKPVDDPKDLARKIAGVAPGSAAEIIVWRDGAEKALSVSISKLEETAAAQPTPDAPAETPKQELSSFGLKVAPNDAGKGVVVTDVDPDSIAAERGLSAGDIIVAANSADVSSADEISKAADAAQKLGRKSVLLQVESENGSRFIALPVAKG
ncbi:MAG: Do family serine endopeptidase [Rhizobiaceae bacterium]